MTTVKNDALSSNVCLRIVVDRVFENVSTIF